MSTINPGVTGRRPHGGRHQRRHRPQDKPAGTRTEPAQDSEPVRTQVQRRRRAALTMSVPEAGAKYFGLGRNASYAAAESGTIPTIRVGRLLRVPIAAMERMMLEAGKEEAAA